VGVDQFLDSLYGKGHPLTQLKNKDTRDLVLFTAEKVMCSDVDGVRYWLDRDKDARNSR
jgi:hypothetical protein